MSTLPGSGAGKGGPRMARPALVTRSALVAVVVLLGGCTVPSDRRVSTSPAAIPSLPTQRASGTTARPSGIEGIAEADPQCPIQQPGAPCPPSPVSRPIGIFDGTTEVARFTSASDGRFRVPLPSGTYTLREIVPSGQPPSLKPVEVTVPPGTFVHVVLLFDTGIR